MDKGALGARNQIAQERIVGAATVLAARFDLAFSVTDLTVQARDPAVRAMMQRERVADLLEALVKATGPADSTEGEPAPKRRRPRRE